MKKIRIFLIAIAITIGVGGAVAHEVNKRAYCDYFPQYVPNGGGDFRYAGQIGVNYLCFTSVGTCTYYQPNPVGPYLPCRSGLYIPLF
jgi:hypothetical protein